MNPYQMRFLKNILLIELVVLFLIAAGVFAYEDGQLVNYLKGVIFSVLITTIVLLSVLVTILKKTISDQDREIDELNDESVKYQDKCNKLKSKFRKAKWYNKFYLKEFTVDNQTQLLAAAKWKKYLKKKFPFG